MMNIDMHRVSSITATSKDYPAKPHRPAFSVLKLRVESDRYERAEFTMFGDDSAAFAAITKAINEANWGSVAKVVTVPQAEDAA